MHEGYFKQTNILLIVAPLCRFFAHFAPPGASTKVSCDAALRRHLCRALVVDNGGHGWRLVRRTIRYVSARSARGRHGACAQVFRLPLGSPRMCNSANHSIGCCVLLCFFLRCCIAVGGLFLFTDILKKVAFCSNASHATF